MARYRTIDVRIWGDQKFCELSPPQPNGQSLWVYLFTGEHTGPLPGLYRVGELALAESLRWDLEAFRRCWSEIAARQMAIADWATRVLWIPNRIYYAEPENPNVVKSWRAAWDEIPECALKADAWAVFDAYMVERDELARDRAQKMGKEPPHQSFAETFRKCCPQPGKGSRKGIEKGSRKGSGNGMANQDQDQEQDLSPQPPCRGADEPRPGKRPTRAERKRAEELRKRVYGRCPHTPRCESYSACIDALVLEARAPAPDAAARDPPATAEDAAAQSQVDHGEEAICESS